MTTNRFAVFPEAFIEALLKSHKQTHIEVSAWILGKQILASFKRLKIID